MKVIKIEAVNERIELLKEQKQNFAIQANNIMAEFNGQIKALENLLKTPEELAAEQAAQMEAHHESVN